MQQSAVRPAGRGYVGAVWIAFGAFLLWAAIGSYLNRSPHFSDWQARLFGLAFFSAAVAYALAGLADLVPWRRQATVVQRRALLVAAPILLALFALVIVSLYRDAWAGGWRP